MKVMLDANVIIGMLLSRNPDSPVRTIARWIAAGAYTLILPATTAEEVRVNVASKSYLQERITQQEVEGLFLVLLSTSILIETLPNRSGTPILRDPDDDYLIVTARHAQIDVLISRDKDVTAHSGNELFAILTPSECVAAFRSLLEQRRGGYRRWRPRPYGGRNPNYTCGTNSAIRPSMSSRM